MRLNTVFSLLLAVLAMSLFGAGCVDTETANSTNQGAAESHEDGHDHGDDDHDHGDHDHPAHGPNGGHIFAFDDEGVQGEWCKYKDNDVIRMYLLAEDGKTAKPMKVDQFVVKPSVGKDATEFVMEAEDTNDEGLASTFMADDKALTIAIPLGVEIVVTSGDQTLTGKIEPHEPRDH